MIRSRYGAHICSIDRGPLAAVAHPSVSESAYVVSDVGTFMQSVGAAWLMISLKGSPISVALIQTASALPFFMFALPAGAIGDIVDRRRLILYSETWMLLVAIAVAGLTIAGRISPLLLLIMTFALSAGDHLRPLPGALFCPKLCPKKIFRLLRL